MCDREASPCTGRWDQACSTARGCSFCPKGCECGRNQGMEKKEKRDEEGNRLIEYRRECEI